MVNHPRLYPAIFSFLMPGLGQVYLQKFARALLIFSVFTACTFFSYARVLAPLVAVVACWDAWRLGVSAQKPDKGRLFSYATVGTLGILFWFSLVAPTFLPVGAQMEVMAAGDRLARMIRKCANQLGHVPDKLEECAGMSSKDPWNHEFRYRVDGKRFELKSAGRDGVFGNRDDFVFHYVAGEGR